MPTLFETEEEKAARLSGQKGNAPLIAPVQPIGPYQGGVPGAPPKQASIWDTMSTMAVNKAANKGLDYAGEQLVGTAAVKNGAAATQGLIGTGGKLAPSAGSLLGGEAATAAATAGAEAGMMATVGAAAPWLALGYLGGKKLKLFENGTTNVSGGPFAKYANGTTSAGFPEDIKQQLLAQGGGTIEKDGVIYQADVTRGTEQDPGGELVGLYTYKAADNKTGGAVQHFDKDTGTHTQTTAQQKVPTFVQGLAEAVATAAPFVMPGLGAGLGGALGIGSTAGSALMSGGLTKLAGGDWSDALRSAALAGGMAHLTGGGKNTGSNLGDTTGFDMGDVVPDTGTPVTPHFDTTGLDFGDQIPVGGAPVTPWTPEVKAVGGDSWTGTGSEFDLANADVHTDEIGRIRSNTIQDMLERGYDIESATEIANSQMYDKDIIDNIAASEKAVAEHNALQKVAQDHNWKLNTDAQTPVKTKSIWDKAVEVAKENPLVTAAVGIPVAKEVVKVIGGGDKTRVDTTTADKSKAVIFNPRTGQPVEGTGVGGSTIWGAMPKISPIVNELGDSLALKQGPMYNPIGLNTTGMVIGANPIVRNIPTTVNPATTTATNTANTSTSNPAVDYAASPGARNGTTDAGNLWSNATRQYANGTTGVWGSSIKKFERGTTEVPSGVEMDKDKGLLYKYDPKNADDRMMSTAQSMSYSPANTVTVSGHGTPTHTQNIQQVAGMNPQQLARQLDKSGMLTDRDKVLLDSCRSAREYSQKLSQILKDKEVTGMTSTSTPMAFSVGGYTLAAPFSINSSIPSWIFGDEKERAELEKQNREGTRPFIGEYVTYKNGKEVDKSSWPIHYTGPRVGSQGFLPTDKELTQMDKSNTGPVGAMVQPIRPLPLEKKKGKAYAKGSTGVSLWDQFISQPRPLGKETPLGSPSPKPPSKKGGVGSRGGLPGKLGIPNMSSRLKRKGGGE